MHVVIAGDFNELDLSYADSNEFLSKPRRGRSTISSFRRVVEGIVKEAHGVGEKGECWRIRLETGLARKRSQKIYKLIGVKPFALSLMMPL